MKRFCVLLVSSSATSTNEGPLTLQSFRYEDIVWDDDLPNNENGEIDPVLALINEISWIAPEYVQDLLIASRRGSVTDPSTDLVGVMYELMRPQYLDSLFLGNLRYQPTRFLDMEICDASFMGEVQAYASFSAIQLRFGTVSSFTRRIYFTFEETSCPEDANAGKFENQNYTRLLTDIPTRYHPVKSQESDLRGTQEDFFDSVGTATRRKTWHTDGREFTTWTVSRAGQIPPLYGLPSCESWVELETILAEIQPSAVRPTIVNPEDDVQELGYIVQQLQGALEWLSHPLRNVDQRPRLQRRDLTLLLEQSEGLKCKYCDTEGVHRNGDCFFS